VSVALNSESAVTNGPGTASLRPPEYVPSPVLQAYKVYLTREFHLNLNCVVQSVFTETGRARI
jgi:hypothetical protein